jgi:hypothetical protein
LCRLGGKLAKNCHFCGGALLPPPKASLFHRFRNKLGNGDFLLVGLSSSRSMVMVELFDWVRSCWTSISSMSRGSEEHSRKRQGSLADRARCRPRLETLERRELMARDVILDWNSVMLQANANDHALAKPEQGGPVLTGRAFAIVSVAMYDAYNSIKPTGTAYLTTAPVQKGANVDAAVAQAARDTLVELFPAQQPLFDKSLKATLKNIPNGPKENRGRAVGSYVATQILAARANDGTEEVMQPGYVASGEPGFHAVDPMHPDQGYYGSGASHVTPFAMGDVNHFEARELDDATVAGRAEFLASPEYTNAFNEVLAYGGNGTTSPTQRTHEQTVIGIYWGYDGRPGLGTPPRLYNQIAQTIAKQRHNTEGQNARLFALVNIAMADAGIASWNTKYDDAVWRPVMGLRYGDDDGNPATDGDANWQPLGAPASNPRPGETNFTPPFPAYTSGHATFGAAAFQILTRFYGSDEIKFTFVSDEYNGKTKDADGSVRPLIRRSFDSFTEAKLENAQSRIYLGIHWAFDRDEGIKQGDAVANYIFENSLKPNPKTMPIASGGRLKIR